MVLRTSVPENSFDFCSFTCWTNIDMVALPCSYKLGFVPGLRITPDANMSLHLSVVMCLFYTIATLSQGECCCLDWSCLNTVMQHVSWGRAVLASSHTKLFFQLKFLSAHWVHRAGDRPCWNERDSIKAVTYSTERGFFVSAELLCFERKGLCFLRTDAEQLLTSVKSCMSWTFATSK